MGKHWAVRQGDWKLLFDPADTSNGRDFPPNQPEDMHFLVNLATDIGEQHNLAAQYPQKVRELTEIHERWVKDWE